MNRAILLVLAFLPSAILAGEKDLDICKLSENLVCGESTSIHYLGQLEGGYNVYSYVHVFGASHRAANRIIFLDKADVYLGMYATPEVGDRIQDSCVVFPIPEDEGNKICIEGNRLPKVIWLGGENPELFQ